MVPYCYHKLLQSLPALCLMSELFDRFHSGAR